MRNRLLPMFTPAEQAAFSQASENARRLNTSEFRAGLAETQQLPIESNYLVESTDNAPATIAKKISGAALGLNLSKFIKPIMLVTVSAAVTLLLMSGHEDQLRGQLTANVNSKPAHEILVSAADPKLANQPVSDPLVVQQEISNPASLLAPAKTDGLQLVIPERDFSHISQPRTSSESSFISVPMEQSVATSKRSELAALGLRPIPNSNQRYVSSSGLEWQGGWELNNPQANIERGDNYMRYLSEKFSSNNHKQLLVQSRESDALAISAAEHPVEIPILKYSE